VQWSPLLLSFEVATIATLLAVVGGVALGALLASRRFFGRDLLDVLVTAPLVLPPTVLGYYVLVAVGRRGALGRGFEAIFGTSIVFTKVGVILAATLGALPIVVKAARAAIESVDPTFVAAARTLGATPLRALFTVTLPLAARGIVAGAMLGFARALGDFGVTLMVAGNLPGETQTASLAIYDAIQGGRDADAAGMIAVLSAFAVAVLYLVNKLSGSRDAG
jgi:molybdate transport system permease protein